MNLGNEIIAGMKVINISEENASAIERMVNDTIKAIYQDDKKILDVQITDDNIFFILGMK